MIVFFTKTGHTRVHVAVFVLCNMPALLLVSSIQVINDRKAGDQTSLTFVAGSKYEGNQYWRSQ